MEQRVTKSGRLTASEQKRLAILENALAMLLKDGFDGMNMDELSERALVSKATIYNRFGSKEDLFVEVVAHSLKQNRDKIVTEDLARLPAREGLLQVAFELTSMFGRDDDMLRLCKLCIVVAERFPLATEAFLRSGPGQGTEQVAEYIKQWQERGELKPADPLLAAQQLAELSKTSIFDKRIFGHHGQMSVARCREVAEEAVATFLARYGAEG